MGRGTNKTFTYLKPHPFNTPNVFFQKNNIATGLPRETIPYSAKILEEIMFNIDEEYTRREKTKPQWKAYRGGIDDFVYFSPNPNTGAQLAAVAVKFFPQIVRDIQKAIEGLLNDKTYADDLGSYLARIFGNNTIHTIKNFWSFEKCLKDNIIVPATNHSGKQTLNPLTNAINGAWPFSVKSPGSTSGYNHSDGHVENPLVRMGVDFLGNKFIKNEAGSIETSASDYPASVIGKIRTEENIARVNGELVFKKGSSITGVDGVDIPMRPEGRPGPASRKNEQNTSTGYGKGLYDPDAGYSFIGHHPLVIHQLRWQPPIIELFNGPDKIPLAHYTQKVYSNTTINLPFVFDNPVEKTWFFNWGQWLVKGKASSDSGGLTLIAAPDQYNGHIQTTCPFSVFYPPPSVNCSCGAGDTSYAVWGAGGLKEPLVWNSSVVFQSDNPNTRYKKIGPKTRIRVKHTYQASPGSPNARHYYAIVVRLNSIAGVNLQPFIPIYVAIKSNPQPTLTNYLDVQDLDIETHGDSSFSVNITDAIKKTYPQYKGEGDFITAMAIFVHQEVSGTKSCSVIDLPGGSEIDSACRSSLTCSMGTITTKTTYISLYEPPIEQNDDRLPK